MFRRFGYWCHHIEHGGFVAVAACDVVGAAHVILWGIAVLLLLSGAIAFVYELVE